MVYLIDTRNGNNQIVNKNEFTEFYSDEWRESVSYDLPWFGEAIHRDKIVVMTYAKFGILADRFPQFGYDFELILCDELHSLPKFRSFSSRDGSVNSHIAAQKRLEEIVNQSGPLVVAISATPDNAVKYINCPFRYITVDNDVRRLETRQIIPYTNRMELLKKLSPHQKGIVYIARVTGMILYQKAAEAMGFRTVCIWSDSHQGHPMTEEQKKAREYILQNEELPPQYDMVIVNASCETGINIGGKVDYIVVHNSSEDTRTQIRGRYRKDLECLYVHSNNTISVPEEFLDCKLFTKEKGELCAAIKLQDEKGRTYKWPTIRNRLKEAGYSIIEDREKSKWYAIISR